MVKALIITEKPSVARDITEALGGFKEKEKGEYYESDEFLCTYAVGHIFTLLSPEDIDPIYKRWRLNDLPILPKDFAIKPLEKQKKRVAVIGKLINRSDVTNLINACDAAREGELIFREIVKYFQATKPMSRLWLQSMTKAAIREGFKKLGEDEKFRGLGFAAHCRANADWLIGMNATRALTVRLKSRNQQGLSWSAGRVQTPTLSLLVNREMEILEHSPIPYARVHASFKTDDHEYQGTWYDPKFRNKENSRDLKEDRIFDAAKAAEIVENIKDKPAVAREVRKPSPRKPPLLFDLTSLQRTANTRFGWSATRTLRAAQRCYEAHKVLTYPRTSSKVLPEDYRGEVDRVLGVFSSHAAYGRFAQHLLKNGRKNEDKIFDNSGVTDHFAIVPTGEVSSLSGDDEKLFDLVTRQFLAAFYPPSVYEDVERITEVAGESFRSKPPKVLKDPGWEIVFEKSGSDEVAFPPLAKGKNEISGVNVHCNKGDTENLDTKPPARISEAGLLSLMEHAGRQVDDEELATALMKAEGLGTAATRADIIENLKLREYVSKALRPTVKGIRLIDVLSRIGTKQLTSAELTARLELHLDQVEDGKRTSDDFMNEIVGYVKEVVDSTKSFDFESIYPNENPLGKCPKCGGPVYEKAWFYGCEESTKRIGKKDCEFLIWKDHNGRYINRLVVRKLLEKGETEELDGFYAADGRTYKAILSLNGTELVRKTTAQEELEGMEVSAEPLGPCPLHKDCRVIETSAEYLCETRKKAKEAGVEGESDGGFNFPRLLCKRPIKREEVMAYMKEGKTPVLAGFISKRGRKFSATLVMNPDKKGFQFVFPERAPRKKKGEESGAEAEAEM
ncbi:MAG: DNA topoisomerase [Oligoflexales bacterium]